MVAFTLFDAVGVLEYFAKASEFTMEQPTKATRPIRDVVEAIYGNDDRDSNVRVLARRMQRIVRGISAEGREMMKAFVPDGDIASFGRGLGSRLDRDWAGSMGILRDPSFLALLEKYPRAHSKYIVALEAQDTVTSAAAIRTADGRTLKPSDYISAFSQFVRDNSAQVAAIRILLERPRHWSTEALKELRIKLAARPRRFTEDNLRRAYGAALADIISIVYYGADETDPLLSAEERVDKAQAAVRGGRRLDGYRNDGRRDNTCACAECSCGRIG